MERYKEEIYLESNLLEFKNQTDSLLNDWSTFQHKIIEITLTNKNLSRSVKTMVKHFNEMSGPINELTKISELSDYLSKEEFDKLIHRADEIKNYISSIMNAEEVNSEQIQNFYKLISKRKTYFEKILKTAKNVVDSKKDQKEIDEKLNDLISGGLNFRKQQIKNNLKINKEVYKIFNQRAKGLDKIKNIRLASKVFLEKLKIFKESSQATKIALEVGQKAFKTIKTVMQIAAATTGIGLLFAALSEVSLLAAKFFETDKEIKDLQKNLHLITAKGGKWLNASLSSLQFAFNNLQQVEKNLFQTRGTAHEWLANLVDAGFQFDESIKNLEDVSGIANRLGVDFGTMSQLFGQVRESLGYQLPEITRALVQMTDEADKSQMNLMRFYTKVINAASELTFYGTKLTDLSNLFYDILHQTELPEKYAGDFARNLSAGFKDLNLDQKRFVVSGSKFEDQIRSLDWDLIRQGNEEQTNLLAQIMGFTEVNDQVREVVKRFKKSPNTAAGMVELLMKSTPAKQFQTRLERLLKNLYIDTEQGVDKIYENFNQKTLDHIMEVGKEVGLGSEEIAIELRNFLANLKENQKAIEDLGKKQQELDEEKALKEIKIANVQVKKLTKSMIEQTGDTLQRFSDNFYELLQDELIDIQLKIEKATRFLENLVSKIPNLFKDRPAPTKKEIIGKTAAKTAASIIVPVPIIPAASIDFFFFIKRLFSNSEPKEITEIAERTKTLRGEKKIEVHARNQNEMISKVNAIIKTV